MATIKSYPFARHLRSTPTAYVVHASAGRQKHAGAGAAFWFRPPSAAISEVPVDDREMPLMAHARTADLQDVAVAATVSPLRRPGHGRVAHRLRHQPRHRVVDGQPARAGGAQLLTESATGLVMDAVAPHAGRGDQRRRRRVRYDADAWAAGRPAADATGISVLGARVRAIRAEADLSGRCRRRRARRRRPRPTPRPTSAAPSRSSASARSPRTARTASSFAAREQELVAQEGANARRRAEEAAAAALVEATAAAEREAPRLRHGRQHARDRRGRGSRAGGAHRGVRRRRPSGPHGPGAAADGRRTCPRSAAHDLARPALEVLVGLGLKEARR